MNYTRRAFLGCAALSAVMIPAAAQESKKSGSLERVDPKYVCFINKHRFDKEQLPVSVEGKTYYGCCDMCKAKLKDDPAARFDTDPVSGKKVDKATAVIGADADSKVYFFENEDDLKKFRPPTTPSK